MEARPRVLVACEESGTVVDAFKRRWGVVLDPFAGSGTTLVAAKMLGRDCIGIEREEENVEIIRRRLGEE